MRCPQYPQDHVFKIPMTQNEARTGRRLFCPYCGHQSNEIRAFAQEQYAIMEAAAEAVAEQFLTSKIDGMFNKAFGGRSRSGSSSGGFGISMEFKPGRPPARRSLPSLEVEETRRTMQCEECQEFFAVYGLAIYCPRCGQLAPAQQFAELLRMHQERLAALADLPEESRRALVENGVTTATYESTIKDGFSALETYLKMRFSIEAPVAFPSVTGAVFQRLDEAADLYLEYLNVDLRGLVGEAGWEHLLQVAAVRHLLVHSSGVVDARFLARQPQSSQTLGQRLHVSEHDARLFLDVLTRLAAAVRPS
jgi:Zn finger protein HypA/HybF involved in hydrogenase expression